MRGGNPRLLNPGDSASWSPPGLEGGWCHLGTFTHLANLYGPGFLKILENVAVSVTQRGPYSQAGCTARGSTPWVLCFREPGAGEGRTGN